ncbi:hypothetical protein [Sulfitobacter dubius]|uniref:hypothetical protein n=1 Tax=Sulfitobacter dubius TaxID=218673 RepID=UPI002942C0FA|nr:hypothetical protein [Sulfitobacter dubius]WOI29347.1 hypothetical protein R1T39_01155 [Sulfitobacter dubius]
MSDAESEPDYKALLEKIRDRRVSDRRLSVRQYHDDNQSNLVRIVNEIVETQLQIEALERAIESETTPSSPIGILG